MTHTDGEADDVGSLAEEAAKLFGVLSGWARENGGDVGGSLSDLAAHAAASAQRANEQGAGSADCTLCPACRTIHAVRHLNPDVKQHLVSAATSLAQAAASLMATQVPDEPECDHERPEDR